MLIKKNSIGCSKIKLFMKNNNLQIYKYKFIVPTLVTHCLNTHL